MDKKGKEVSSKIIERIEQIRNSYAPLEKAEQRSQEMLSKLPTGQFFIGLVGIETDSEIIEMHEGIFKIRRVVNPPGIVHVCRAADLSVTDYMGVGRYSSAIKAELIIWTPDEVTASLSLEDGWHLIALLKILGHQGLIAPVAATSSWDAICALKNNSVKFYLLDDHSRILKNPNSSRTLSTQDIDWVNSHYLNALNLRDRDSGRRFGLAFNLSYSWNHTNDFRVALSNLWAGLDALFGDQSDRPVTKKLLQRIESWNANHYNESRLRELYEIRCDAIHGRWLEEGVIKATFETADILNSSLKRCVESKSQPLPDRA